MGKSSARGTDSRTAVVTRGSGVVRGKSGPQVARPGVEASRCTALEAALRIAQGKSTAVKLAEACLTRIEEREKEVEAWAYIDRSQVLKQARERDKESARSLLHGVPVGVKDIIDTYDMPTEYGSSIYRGHRPQRDAACVAMLREAGLRNHGQDGHRQAHRFSLGAHTKPA